MNNHLDLFTLIQEHIEELLSREIIHYESKEDLLLDNGYLVLMKKGTLN